MTEFPQFQVAIHLFFLLLFWVSSLQLFRTPCVS